MVSVRDPIRRRQPVERPLDIVGLELLVSVSQALLVGILLSLAAQLGGDARAQGLPVPGLLAVLGIVVGVGWIWWLVGGSGWVMSAVCFGAAILAGALWLLSLSDPTLPRIDPLVGLIAVACAIYGVIAGVFLPGPRREHWKGGISEPKRGLPQTRATPARFSPPVQRVVDERLSNVSMPRVALPKVSLPAARGISLSGTKLLSRSDKPATDASSDDGLAAAPDIPPHPTDTRPAPAASPAPAATPPQAVAPASAAATGPAADAAPAPAAREPVVVEVERPVEATVAAVVADADLEADDDAVSDPDAPTQPVERAAAAWPRPIEPRGARPHDEDEPSA